MIRTRLNGMTRTKLNGGNGNENQMPKPRYSVSRKGMGGRPTKYNPEMCDVVIKCMLDGGSRYEVFRELFLNYDIRSYGTMLDYEEEHLEFSESLKNGTFLSQGWWERKSRLALNLGFGEKFSTGPWLINMINRFGWKSANSMIKEEKSGKIEQIQTQRKEISVNIDVAGLPDMMIEKLLDMISQARTSEGKRIAAEPTRDTLH